jgi:hypothetical protein
MRNKLVIGALVLLAVLAVVVPAVGQTKHAPTPATSFTASGQVQDVIRSAGALRIHVDSGSRGVNRFIGGSLVVRVASQARILMVSDGIASLGTLSDIRVGDQVVVGGRIDRSQPSSPVYVAQNVRVLDRTPAGRLTRFAGGGPVTAVDAQGTPNSLTLTLSSASHALWDRLGTSLTVVVTPDTRIFRRSDGTTTDISLSQVAVGERVWVTGAIDRSQAAPVFTAGRITVQPVPTPSPTVTPGG